MIIGRHNILNVLNSNSRGKSSGSNWTPQSLGAPRNLVLAVIDGNTLQVNFTGTTGQDGYRAYISVDGVDFSSYVDNANTTFNLTGLTVGTKFWIYIVAYKGATESAASNTAYISTLPTNKLLFLGLKADIADDHMPNTLGDDYLTVAGSEGSETYVAPNNAAYLNADTDNIFFNPDTSQRTATTAQLVGYDLSKVFVKYANSAPYTISKIGILKSGEVLTASEIDSVCDYFDLPLLWKGTTSSKGRMKGNRATEKKTWSYTIAGTYLHRPNGNEYAYVADNGALDCLNAGFSMGAWVRGTTATAGVLQIFLGKQITLSVSGRYDFYCDTDNKIAALVQGNTAVKIITSTVLITDQVWHWLFMTVSPGGLLRFYIDNVEIGSVQTAGTCVALANQFEYYIGTGNNGPGNGVNYTSKTDTKDVIIYMSVLTTEERTALFNGMIKSGYKAFWTCDRYPITDKTGNFNLTGANLTISNIL
jgi:hypothetical protein